MIQPELSTVYEMNYSTAYTTGRCFKDLIYNTGVYSHKFFFKQPIFL